jgi:hypothetical protein
MTQKQQDLVTNGESKEEMIHQPDDEMSIISVPARGLQDIEAEIQRLEKNVELFNRIKIVSLKLTKESDWVFQNQDSPYLMDRGAENIAIAWGIDISDVKLRMEWEEDDDGRYYAFVATGKAYSKKLGRQVEDVGVCSQRDKFFGMAGGKRKEIHEIDMANIRRKAVTNLYNRLIKRCVGLTSVTKEDLQEAGHDVKKIQGIKYDSGSQKSQKRRTAKEKEVAEKLLDMLMMMANEDKNRALELLGDYSSFKNEKGEEIKAKSLKSMSEKWLKSTYGKVKADFEKMGPPPEEKEGEEENGNSNPNSKS